MITNSEEKTEPRHRGRPHLGKIDFQERDLDGLPDKGGMRQMARALGVTLRCIQQWCGGEKPLRVRRDTQFRPVLFKKDIKDWLLSSGRLHGKAKKCLKKAAVR